MSFEAIRKYLGYLAPVLTLWTEHVASLREIARDDVQTVLKSVTMNSAPAASATSGPKSLAGVNAPGRPSPLARRWATSVTAPTVNVMPSPVRSQPSRTRPDGHSTRARPQDDRRGRSLAVVVVMRASRRVAKPARPGKRSTPPIAGRAARTAGLAGARAEAPITDGAPLACQAAKSSLPVTTRQRAWADSTSLNTP